MTTKTSTPTPVSAPSTPTPEQNPNVFSARVKSPKLSLKKLLPFLLSAAALTLIIVLAVIMGGAQPNDSLKDNIDDAQISWSAYTEKEITLSGSLKITDPGVYTLTGSIPDGLIEINTSGVVKLILNGVSITNSSGPAILVSEAKTVVIETAAGSKNTLTDGSTYSTSDEDICATLFSKDELVLQGEGTLIVEGNYEDGIVSKDDLKLSSGTYTITAKDDALRGRDSVYIAGGTLSITSGGDAIKSNNSDEVGKGTILIDAGTLTLSAGDDGIHAESSLEINGGTISVEKSYEGLEAAKITINGGDITVNASDDGVNAAGGNDSSSPNMMNYQSTSSNYSIEINGGTLSVNSLGDGIDSNGSLTFNGGTVYVDGPTNSANGALDAEGTVAYNGGTLVALGASGMAVAPTASASTGYSLSAFLTQTYPAGTLVSLKNSSGATVVEYTSKKTFSHIALAADGIKSGEEYTLYLGSDSYATFTATDKTTQLGSGGMMGPGGDMMMGPGGNAGGNNGGNAAAPTPGANAPDGNAPGADRRGRF